MRIISANTKINQRGFTLVELLIAVTLGLFLLGGIVFIEQSNHSAFIDQQSMVKLQDQERIAMIMMSDVIQQAGYDAAPNFDPLHDTDFSVAGDFGTLGQSIAYVPSASAASVAARFKTGPGDGMINCSGTSNQTGAYQMYTNEFSVVGGNLVCTMNATPYVLVSGVQSMSVLYGVNRLGVNTGGTAVNSGFQSVDTYMNGSQVDAGVCYPYNASGYSQLPSCWLSVISVVITLNFKNPLTGPQQPLTIPARLVIPIQSHLGIRTNL